MYLKDFYLKWFRELDILKIFSLNLPKFKIDGLYVLLPVEEGIDFIFAKDLFIDVYTNIHFVNKKPRVLFFDLDNPSKKKAILFASILTELFDEKPVIISSGRGWHFYYKLNPKFTLKDFYATALWLKSKFPDYDSQCTIDVARLARLPYSINPRTFRLSQVAKISNGNISLLSPKEAIPFVDNISFADKIPIQKFYGQQLQYPFKFKYGPPCTFRWLVDLINNRPVPHYARFNIVASLKEAGWSKEEIFKLFSFRKDFNPRVTWYQINYIFKRDLRPLSCPKSIIYGACRAMLLGEPCEYFSIANKEVLESFKDKKRE